MASGAPGAPALSFRALVITDVNAGRVRSRGVVECVARALDRIAHGAHHAQGEQSVAILVRDKQRSVDDVARVCEAVRAVAGERARVLVHTHTTLVNKLGLHGVHFASTATTREVEDARATFGPGALIGVSRHAGDALDEKALSDVDYVTLSPVFAPLSKSADARAQLGLEGLRAHVARSARPVVALGGVDQRNARACIEHGASAVAVIGAVMSARDPGAVTTSITVALG